MGTSVSFFSLSSNKASKIKLLKLAGSPCSLEESYQYLCNWGLGLSTTSILRVGRFNAASTTSIFHGTSWSLKPNQTQGFHWTEATGNSTNDLTHSETMTSAAGKNIELIFTAFLRTKHWSKSRTKIRQIFRPNVSKIAKKSATHWTKLSFCVLFPFFSIACTSVTGGIMMNRRQL